MTTLLLKLRAWFQGGSQLDTMRNSQPQLPASYQQTGSFPPAGYDDPRPSNTSNYDSYLTRLSERGNATGVAGGLPMQATDPTAGSASVGGWSYNLDSGNYNFTLPALSLPGRAGMNLSLALSYNSKVWTLDAAANTMVFNGDRGFPAPGWRLGFGSIQIKDPVNGVYTSGITGKASIIYLAPDGTRHEMAYNSETARFETYDSSYIAFDPTAQVMYFPNGTKVRYGDAYSYDVNVRDYQALPIEVKDRNGNFITIVYKDLTTSAGTKKVIDHCIDTAGRRIDFNYQSNLLTSISQNRDGVTFYYVRLDYQPVTIKTRFVAPLVSDPANINGVSVYFPVKVTYPTGINYQFSYTSYAQISAIQKWVPTISGQGGERLIAQTAFTGLAQCIDLNAPPGTQYYCNAIGELPRVAQRQETVENWQGTTANNWSTTVPQIYQYTNGGFDIYDPTSRRFLVQTVGMTQSVSIFANGASSFTKKDAVTYESDSDLPYLSNLRAIQTEKTANNGATVQVKTIQLSYVQRDGMWLPAVQKEYYGSAESFVYRHTVTEYTSYPTQYILGLPQRVSVYAGDGTTLLSRVSNNYNETATFTDSNGQAVQYFMDASSDGAIQHDNTNYHFGFSTRGNLTSVVQHLVGAANVSRITKRISYDTNGNVRSETDAAGNRKQIEYTDNYADKPAGVGVTCVHPYTVADPTGFRSGSQWRYFTGQTKKSFNLLPNDSAEKQIVETNYDFADRPVQTTRPDGGWVKTAYWDNWLASVSSQQVDAGQVRYKFDLMDGAGRAFKKASDHPDGASGKYAGQITAFDKVGQVEDSSNVLAVDGNWIPAGEDAGKNFLFTHLTRDELSRLKIVTLPDNNTRQFGYAGCGCAGNSETTMTDEVGHKTITKTDALGRLVEAEEPNLSNWAVPYSRAEYFYDALDRLVEIRHSSAPLTEQPFTVPTQYCYFNYDGYGRQVSETTPEGGTVTYTYTANNQIATKSDQRNISSAYVYNKRNLVANVSHSDGTPTVVYNYDAYGARSSVTDGEGATSYSYNSFRQLQGETRTFNGLPSNNYTLNYTYNQADQVKSANYHATGGFAAGSPFTQTDSGQGGAESYTISGTVTDAQSQPVSGATVILSGSQSGTVNTNGSGQYSFTGLAPGGNYTVTPSKSGLVFDPSSRSYNNLQSNKTSANFTALPAFVTFLNKNVNYAYNSVGALAGVGTNLIGANPNATTNVLNTVSFRASGALSSLHYGNGRQLTMGYNDQRSQPISMKVDRIGNPADKVLDYEYQYYDAEGKNNNRLRQITDKVDGAFSSVYTYDDYNRLESGGGNFYQYDPWGNIKSINFGLVNAKNILYDRATGSGDNYNNSNAFVYTILNRWDADKRLDIQKKFFRSFDMGRVPGYRHNLPL